MSLGGSFGNQAYVCSTCGHTMTLYAPHCPSCLNNTLNRVNNTKMPPGNATSVHATGQAPASESRPAVAVPLCILALVCAVGAYSMFIAPHPDPAPGKDAAAAARTETHVSSSASSNSQPIRHIRHFAVRAASQPVVRTHSAAVSTAASSNAIAPRRAPMKLWEDTKE